MEIFVKALVEGSVRPARGSWSVSRYLTGEKVGERPGRLLYRADGQRLTLVLEGVAKIHTYDLPLWISPEAVVDRLSASRMGFERFFVQNTDGTSECFDVYLPSEELPGNPLQWRDGRAVFAK